jgi:pimeloyl-ACP methyl ester carboxylesterase
MAVGVEERLVFFPSGPSNLAGVLTIPPKPNGRAVLIPWGAGAFPSSGRNRVRTRLARSFAEEGFHSFRFDYRGVGESGGDSRTPDLAAPYTEDILAACAWLAKQGLPRVVVVANCFGGWSSLMGAPNIQGLEGMALVNAPVWRDHGQVRLRSWRWWYRNLRKFRLSKLASPERRARYRALIGATASSLRESNLGAKGSSSVGLGSRGSRYSGAVRSLVDRGIPILLIYGDGEFRADFESELDRGLRTLIEQARPPSRLATVSERLAPFHLGAQDLLLRELLPWLRELPDHSQ